MESQLVIPLEAADHASGWPRILRIVAALSLIFALVTVFNAGFELHMLFNQGSLWGASYKSDVYKSYASRAVLVAARLAIGAVTLVTAFRLWRSGVWHRVLMISARLWLAIWFLGLILPLYWNRHASLQYITGGIISAIIPAVFPLLIVLTLREYLKAHRQDFMGN